MTRRKGEFFLALRLLRIDCLHESQQPPQSNRIGELCAKIMTYLRLHPRGQDTLVGITEWWLLEQQMHQALGEVRTALERLVEQGQLVARQGSDGRTYYLRNSSNPISL